MPVEDWSTDAHEMRPTNRTRLYLMEKSVKKGMPEKRNKIKEQIQKDKSKNDDKKWKRKKRREGRTRKTRRARRTRKTRMTRKTRRTRSGRKSRKPNMIHMMVDQTRSAEDLSSRLQ